VCSFPATGSRVSCFHVEIGTPIEGLGHREQPKISEEGVRVFYGGYAERAMSFAFWYVDAPHRLRAIATILQCMRQFSEVSLADSDWLELRAVGYHAV
jgi:hypothetical protein